MILILFRIFAFTCAIFISTVSFGADIDLFAGVQPTGAAAAPDVLFMVDTGASFSASSGDSCRIDSSDNVYTSGNLGTATSLSGKTGGVMQCGLYKVIKAMDTTTSTVHFNIGIMFFNKGQKPYNAIADTTSSSGCPSGVGGCLAMPIVPVTANNKANILKWIKAWDGTVSVQSGANRGDGAVMQEMWAYYMGKQGISTVDYSSVSPSVGCASKNVIWIGNNYDTQASPKDVTSAAGSPKDRLTGASSVVNQRANPVATDFFGSIQDTITTACHLNNNNPAFISQPVSTAENKGAYALNWAAYMKSQGITTFAIALEGTTCDPTYAANMEKMASPEVGGGKFYYTSDTDSLVKALDGALGEIEAVNTVFAAVSLPVSVNTQGSYLNQVYIGMFRAADSFNPRWYGNLKQYKLGQPTGSTSTVQLQDADSKSAISSTTGFITGCAQSYWTPDGTDTYWTGNAGTTSCRDSLGAIVGADKSSNNPDGEVVEKGGQAYKVRSSTVAARRVKTCSTASCTALADFSTTTTSAVTGVVSNTLIDWARGLNSLGELTVATTDVRPSVHGDIVHSRPVPINYGTDQSPSIVVYYGGNDGMLRAINGNRGCTTNTTVGSSTYGQCPPDSTGSITSGGATFAAGSELWAFMPTEFYSKINRLYTNTPPISYPDSVALTATPKDYGIDGPITAFQGAVGSVAKSYIYATMRRGGRAIYAFNVTTPGSPTLLWKKGCSTVSPDNTGCTNDTNGDFRGLGQTWSSPKTMYATYYGATTPLLIMGGGYDDCEDTLTSASKNHNCISGVINGSTTGSTGATGGNKIYVLNADTGAIIKQFNTARGVIADVTLVRDSSTGMLQYAYTADLGGNVYRMTFGSGDASTWGINKIADLGCASPASCSDATSNRKFMFAPSVLTTDNVTYYILLGSGDREKPLKNYTASYAVTNYFFMIKDKPSDLNWLSGESSTCGANVLCLGSLLSITPGSPPADIGTKKGWYLGLTTHEQVVTSTVTVFGVTSFSTHIPQENYDSSMCSSGLGTTRVYNVSYLNAANPKISTNLPYQTLPAVGLPPSPVAGLVTLDNNVTVPFCIGCVAPSPLEGSIPTGLSSINQPKSRLYWYIKK